MPGARGLNEWEQLALAQHHGLPTRLLDWTTNSLVAAFFAVNSGKPGEDCEIWGYKTLPQDILTAETLKTPFDLQDVKVVFPAVIAPRIAAQNGLFTVHPTPQMAWEPPKRRVTKFPVSAKNRQYFLRQLFYRGVDHARVFSDLDGIARTLKWQYETGVAVGVVNF